MEELIEKHRFVFFLKLTEELPRMYIHLSRMLTEWGVNLVPVSPRELLTLTGSERAIVLSVCPDLASYKRLLQIRKSFLDMALLSEKLTLIDVSSFSAMSFAKRELRAGISGRRRKSYFHVTMPVTTRFLVSTVLSIYLDIQEKREKWPGGRRAKLPSMGTE